MNKPHKHAEVLRAIADGKEVQFKCVGGDWSDYNAKWYCSPLDCADDIEWRVKPEPKPDYCFYAGYDNKDCCGNLHYSDEDVIDVAWGYKMKITIDGETNLPKSVELVK